MPTDLTIGIAGSGGDGVILLGELLARSAARAGLHATLVKSFGPQIRGGETSARVRVADRPLSGVDHRLDALLLFEFTAMQPFSSELPLAADTQVFVDSAAETPPHDAELPRALAESGIRVPLAELALSEGRSKQAKNMVLAGVVLEYYGWPEQILLEMIEQRFRRHGESALRNNFAAVEAGRKWVRENLVGTQLAASVMDKASKRTLQAASLQDKQPPLYFLSGNEAFSLGALHAGCRFMAGYPISPASEILEWMARQLPRFGGACVQAEDEIAAVCLALGASFGGARVLTATSGPGFTLKQEAIGLAHMAELPLVVCNVQRCGPSTGIPTRTEQADLLLAIHGAHGDNPRVVLAATGVADCYELAHTAFEIAEKYQTPVIVLLDQLISQSQQTVAELDLRLVDIPVGTGPALSAVWTRPAASVFTNQLTVADSAGAVQTADAAGGVPTGDAFHRYAITPSGISPRTIPGMPGGEYVAVGIEHDEQSDPTSSQALHQAQTAKRFRKLEGVATEYPIVKTYDHRSSARPGEPGSPTAPDRAKRGTSAGPEPGSILGLLTWGSSYGVCVEAARLLSEAGLPTSVLAPQLLYPLPVEPIAQWLGTMGQIVVVEVNFEGQLFRHLRGYVNLPLDALRLNRAGGTPISLTEILSYIEEHAALPPQFNRGRLSSVLAGTAQ